MTATETKTYKLVFWRTVHVREELVVEITVPAYFGAQLTQQLADKMLFVENTVWETEGSVQQSGVYPIEDKDASKAADYTYEVSV